MSNGTKLPSTTVMSTEKENLNLDFYLDGVTILVVCAIGLGINAMAIGMLCRQKTSSIFVKLMISLVTYDLIYVFLFALCYSMPRLSIFYQVHIFVYLAPYLVPLTQMALTGSVHTTVALTLERYISVVVPFFRQRNNLKAWIFITPVAVLAIVFSFPRFFEMKTVFERIQDCGMEALRITNNSTVEEDLREMAFEELKPVTSESERANCTPVYIPRINVTELRFDPYYSSIYALYLTVIVNTFLPLVILLAMNICIYRTMRTQWYMQEEPKSNFSDHHSNHNQRKSFLFHLFRRRSSSALISEPNHAGSQHHVLHSSGIRRAGGGVNESEFKKRDSKYTRASVVMVVIFVVCNTPRVVPNIMEMIFGQEWFLDTEKCPQWVYVLISINQLLTVLNSTFNFLIYWSFCGRRTRRRANRNQRFAMSTWSSAAMTRSHVDRQDSILGTRLSYQTSVYRTPSPAMPHSPAMDSSSRRTENSIRILTNRKSRMPPQADTERFNNIERTLD